MTDDLYDLGLTQQHVNRLVKALADSPLLQRHVRKQWWESHEIEKTSLIVATPSLTSGSLTASWSSAATASLALAVPPHELPIQTHKLPGNAATSKNRRSLQEPVIVDEDEMIAALNRMRSTPAYQPSPAIVAPPLRSFAPPLCNGVAVVDSSVNGAPVWFVSKRFQFGRSTLRIGSCSFFSIPYGASSECHLRVDKSQRTVRIMLQITNRIVERKRGQKGPLLLVELDVTRSFSKAALTELTTQLDRSHRPDSPNGRPSTHTRSRSQSAIPTQVFARRQRRLSTPGEQIDWCELADEVEDECTLSRTVDDLANSFATTDTAVCTMQTLTLMSELDRLRAQHQDFFVVRASGFHPRRPGHGRVRIPTGLNVPWVSQHWDRDRGSRFLPRPGTRSLRQRVVAAIADHLTAVTPFTARIGEFGYGRSVVATCVPLLESLQRSDQDDDADSVLSYSSSLDEFMDPESGYARPGDEQVGAWVCFLSAECSY